MFLCHNDWCRGKWFHACTTTFSSVPTTQSKTRQWHVCQLINRLRPSMAINKHWILKPWLYWLIHAHIISKILTLTKSKFIFENRHLKRFNRKSFTGWEREKGNLGLYGGLIPNWYMLGRLWYFRQNIILPIYELTWSIKLHPYFPGSIGCVCCVLWFTMIYDDPMHHPCISVKEKEHITSSVAQQVHCTLSFHQGTMQKSAEHCF